MHGFSLCKQHKMFTVALSKFVILITSHERYDHDRHSRREQQAPACYISAGPPVLKESEYSPSLESWV